MDYKKIRKIISTVSKTMTFVISIGAFNMPVYAADNIANNVVVDNLADLSSEDSNCMLTKDNVIEKNGVKVTINDIKGTKNDIRIDASIKFPDENKEGKISVNAQFSNSKTDSYASRFIYNGGRVINLKIEEGSSEGFESNDNVTVSVNIPEYDIDEKLTIPVDLSKSFAKVNEYEIGKDIEVNDLQYTVDNMEVSTLGTCIRLSEPADNFYNSKMGNGFIIKADNDMYMTQESSQNLYYSKDGRLMENMQCENASYDRLENADHISIIPVIKNEQYSENDFFNLDKEIENMHKYMNSYFNQDIKEDKNQNISYNDSFSLADGNTVSITKVERANGKIKVHFNSDSDKDALLMAWGSFAMYSDSNGSETELENKIVYKEGNEYVAEYDDSNNQAAIYLGNAITADAGEYTIGDEISIK